MSMKYRPMSLDKLIFMLIVKTISFTATSNTHKIAYMSIYISHFNGSLCMFELNTNFFKLHSLGTPTFFRSHCHKNFE